jgi:hypothetical protein
MARAPFSACKRRGTCVWLNHVPCAKASPSMNSSVEGQEMPERETVERAEKAKREGKRPTTQAGEFVREEMHHIREGKHGARSTKQAIAIGLSKARRAGVKLRPPKKGQASKRTRESAARAYEAGQKRRAPRRPSAKRSQAISKALRREGRRAASATALARQARSSARRRGAGQRSAAARKAVHTKGPAKRSAAARKAARTRARRRRTARA